MLNSGGFQDYTLYFKLYLLGTLQVRGPGKSGRNWQRVGILIRVPFPDFLEVFTRKEVQPFKWKQFEAHLALFLAIPKSPPPPFISKGL